MDLGEPGTTHHGNTQSEDRHVNSSARDRRVKARSLRRRLAAITPQSSHSQLQSLLFSALPSEIRNLIFQEVLSQQCDLSKPIDISRDRFGFNHAYRTIVNTSFLRTCRRAYCEANTLALRGATHHVAPYGIETYPNTWDHYIHHFTGQQGHNLYHLHWMTMNKPREIGVSQMGRYLRPHLHWRRITWSGRICALAGDVLNCQTIPSVLGSMLPISCEEVNLEVTSRIGANDVTASKEVADAWKQANVAITRIDGVQLLIDDNFSREFVTCAYNSRQTFKSIYVVRVCWRTKTPRREYMHMDYLDCLKTELSKSQFTHEIDVFNSRIHG